MDTIMDKINIKQTNNIKQTKQNIIELEFLELNIDNNKFIISNQIINKE